MVGRCLIESTAHGHAGNIHMVMFTNVDLAVYITDGLLVILLLYGPTTIYLLQKWHGILIWKSIFV